jgi:hypothetical protein
MRSFETLHDPLAVGCREAESHLMVLRLTKHTISIFYQTGMGSLLVFALPDAAAYLTSAGMSDLFRSSSVPQLYEHPAVSLQLSAIPSLGG